MRKYYFGGVTVEAENYKTAKIIAEEALKIIESTTNAMVMKMKEVKQDE